MASSKISTKPPSGMRDFLPGDVARRRHVIDIISKIYASHGFVPVETPSIENLSTLLGKYGDEGDQLLYRILRRRDALAKVVDTACDEGRAARESDLAEQGLRYDLTVPLARVVAQYGDLPRFFKRYQIQPVWRADRPGRGRFREFYQCDVDIVGTTSVIAEAEVCAAVASVLRELGFANFSLHVNHRQLLRALVRAAGIDASEEGTSLVAVDKLDKIGREGVLAELAQRGISDQCGRRLLGLMSPEVAAGSNEEELMRLRAAVDERGAAAVDELETLFKVAGRGTAGAHLQLSATLARGLGYYTGPIFEISVPDLGGSLGGGGRYDELVGMFGKKQIPAVGFSLGLERILVVMQERGMYPDLQSGVDIMLCWRGVDMGAVVAVGSQLRQQGLRVEVYPEPAKLGKQIQYADTAGVGARYAAVLGEAELEAGTLTIKHLESGEQSTLPVPEAGAWIAGRN